MLPQQQAWKNDGNLGRKTPRFNGVNPCPVILRTHGLNGGNNFLKKHIILFLLLSDESFCFYHMHIRHIDRLHQHNDKKPEYGMSFEEH